MKIVHICLASNFTEGMTYQDNLLSEQNVLDGLETILISNCYKYVNGILTKTSEEDRILNNGVRLIRLEFDNILNRTISNKVRKASKLIHILESEKPNIILFHGIVGWELINVANYKKRNPTVKLYVDSHQDYHNSGKTWYSMLLQYKLFNRFILRQSEKYIDKFFYISLEARNLMSEIYRIADDRMEFYPLGGFVVNKDKKLQISHRIRKSHNFSDDDIIIVHSGKLTPSKRTKELIEAFKTVKDCRLKLIIVGSIPDEQKGILYKLFKSDQRILYVGWKDSEELIHYLCTADIYFQPGTQSATLQNAICCGCPIAVYPYTSHIPYVENNGFFISSSSDYIKTLQSIVDNPEVLMKMSENSYNIAKKLLDYKVLAARLYK